MIKMWWRLAKISALKGFGGGIVIKNPSTAETTTDEGKQAQEANQRAMQIRKMNPTELPTEAKLRNTPNRGGEMHTPPMVNVHQTTEALLELVGDKNKSSFRPDQHEGPWNDQPPTNPDVSKNSFPVVPPR